MEPAPLDLEQLVGGLVDHAYVEAIQPHSALSDVMLVVDGAHVLIRETTSPDPRLRRPITYTCCQQWLVAARVTEVRPGLGGPTLLTLDNGVVLEGIGPNRPVRA